MRIILVNWARIWDGATGGGGVNGYCQSLALRLSSMGHEVVSLCGGTAYTESPADCHVRRHKDWMGIRVFEVYNSPVLAPSAAQMADPDGEVRSPILEEVVAAFFRVVQPDVVHFHNIEGFSAGCVSAAKAAGAATVFSLHNYHTICPQVYLMQRHRVPCRDFENGHACARCVEMVDPAVERATRLEMGFDGPKAYVPLSVKTAAKTVPEKTPTLNALKGELLSAVGLKREEPTRDADPAGDSVVFDAAAPLAAMPGGGKEDTRGKSRYLLEELKPRQWPDPADVEWQPLDNDPLPEPPSDREPNAYGCRRAAMIAMLNGCDRVLAVSDFVRLKFEALGVERERISTVHIGAWINDVAARHQELVFAPPAFADEPDRPIRLVFIGFNHWYKGLGMLADALELLTPRYLGKLDLHISALGGETIEWRFRRLEPRLARLTFHLGYEYHDIPWICGGKDLGVVSSVWWDNGPQTVFEFAACGVPVLGARLGGIPDFVKHDENGLLFRGNDRYDLARTLVRVIREPTILDRLRTRVKPPKSVAAHAQEMENVYAQCVSSPAGAGVGGEPT
jgi:glycosyltransferase involved in cell wall biosynthesis